MTVRMFRKIIVLLLLLAASFAVAQNDGASVLRQADIDFCKATREKALEGWLSWFADDAVLLQFKPPAQGKEGIRKAYEKFFQLRDLNFQWTPERAEIFPSGALGYTSGRYTLAFTDEKGIRITRTGSYLTVWQLQKDRTWKAVSDFGSPDAGTGGK